MYNKDGKLTSKPTYNKHRRWFPSWQEQTAFCENLKKEILNMKYTLALETDQEHLIAEAENALTERINRETDLIAEGEFDGACAIPPRFPEEPAYWSGYCSYLRIYYLKQQGKQLPEWESEF